MSELDREAVKDAMKEAIKEWLDEKFISFGKWSAMSVGALAIAALLWLILKSQGWQAPH
jgi:uncharacterized membrane protein YraQ (UPF0718 family)